MKTRQFNKMYKRKRKKFLTFTLPVKLNTIAENSSFSTFIFIFYVIKYKKWASKRG